MCNSRNTINNLNEISEMRCCLKHLHVRKLNIAAFFFIFLATYIASNGKDKVATCFSGCSGFVPFNST